MYRNRSNSKDCAVRSNRKVEGKKYETVFLQHLHKTPRLHPSECFEKCHIFRQCSAIHSTEMLRTIILKEGADKSLAQSGRKHATAAKLRIYSTYSPWNSIHFLARCSNCCKPLTKHAECCPSNQVAAAAMTSMSDKKWRPSNCFSVQGTGGSPTWPDPENRVGDQDNGSPGRPVSSGLQVPGEHFRARTRPPWWITRGVFPSKCPSIAPSEMSNTPR